MVSVALTCCLLVFCVGTLNAYYHGYHYHGHHHHGYHGHHEVAFSAAMSSGKYSSGYMVYNRVFLNWGGAYNCHNGIMTAPRSGIYHFSFSMRAYYKSSAWMYMYKNSAIVSRAYAYDPYGYGSAGNTINLYLRRGDQVRMYNSGKLYGSYTATFNGYLISSLAETPEEVEAECVPNEVEESPEYVDNGTEDIEDAQKPE